MQAAAHEHAPTVVLTDLDHTLFHAQLFKEALRQAICSFTGLALHEYDRAYMLMRKKWKEGFSQRAFEQALQEVVRPAHWDASSSACVRAAILELTRDTSMYVFPDVAQFMRTMNTWDARPVLVSYGDPEFQHLKLHGSGLEAFLPDVRFVHGRDHIPDDDQHSGLDAIQEEAIEDQIEDQIEDNKDQLIAEVVRDYPHCRFVYIDDRGHLVDRAKRAFPDLVACHIRRPEGAYADSVSALADHHITSMQSLPFILASCLDCE